MGGSRSFSSGTNNLSVNQYSDINNLFSGGGCCSCWVRITNAGVTGRYFNKTSGSSLTPTSGWGFYNQTGSSPVELRLLQARATSVKTWTAGNILAFNVWHYVTVNWNSDNIDNDPTFYLNGTAQTTTVSQTGIGTIQPDATNTLILGNSNNNDRGFEGQLAYMQMWTRTITMPEILETMKRPGIIRSGLVGFWPVLGSSSPEINLFQGGNTGAVSGAVSSLLGPPITSFH